MIGRRRWQRRYRPRASGGGTGLAFGGACVRRLVAPFARSGLAKFTGARPNVCSVRDRSLREKARRPVLLNAQRSSRRRQGRAAAGPRPHGRHAALRRRPAAPLQVPQPRVPRALGPDAHVWAGRRPGLRRVSVRATADIGLFNTSTVHTERVAEKQGPHRRAAGKPRGAAVKKRSMCVGGFGRGV